MTPTRKIYRVHIPAKPVAKGRARVPVKGGVPYTPKQTVVAEAWVRLCCTQQVGTPRVPGPVAVRVLFVTTPPKSMPRAKREAAEAGGVLPVTKPDWDNLAKLVSDALNGIAWADDAEVASARVLKAYGPAPCTVVAWWQLAPQEAAQERAAVLAEVQGWEAAPAAAGALL